MDFNLDSEQTSKLLEYFHDHIGQFWASTLTNSETYLQDLGLGIIFVSLFLDCSRK